MSYSCPDTILVLDSGLGGLSILRHLLHLSQTYRLHYIADSAHAPYGDKSDQWVDARVRQLIESYPISRLSALVLASNTITAACAAQLRQQYPQLPIIGVEPGLKPALHATRSGHIAVLATALTLNSQKFHSLLAQLTAQRSDVRWHLQACSGLVDAIEAVPWQPAQITQLCQRYCQPLRDYPIDTVVLGCTHYPFVQDYLGRELQPQTSLVPLTWIDTGQAVAQQVTRCVPSPAPILATTGLYLSSSRDDSHLLQQVESWLQVKGTALALHCATA